MLLQQRVVGYKKEGDVMPASFCSFCQEITLVDYTTKQKGDKITTTITCRKCHKERDLAIIEEPYKEWVARMKGLRLDK